VLEARSEIEGAQCLGVPVENSSKNHKKIVQKVIDLSV